MRTIQTKIWEISGLKAIGTVISIISRKKVRKYTSGGCPLFQKFCKFVIFLVSASSFGRDLSDISRKDDKDAYSKMDCTLNCFSLLFWIRWLRNLRRFMTRAEPLRMHRHNAPLNPLFCDVFAAVVA